MCESQALPGSRVSTRGKEQYMSINPTNQPEEELTPAEVAELEALLDEPTLGPYTLEELEAMLTLGITPEDMAEFRQRNAERGTAPGYEY